MSDLYDALKKKIHLSLKNNYGKENYDEDRFGPFIKSDYRPSIKKRFKNTVKKAIGYSKENTSTIKNLDSFIATYLEKLEILWQQLSEADRIVLVEILAYRYVGYKKVKLALNTKDYWQTLQDVEKLSDAQDTLTPGFLHFVLKRFDLKPIGFDIDFYYTASGVATDFIIEQYAYKKNNTTLVEAQYGDVVLDLGGCWGDTALYFAHKVGATGKVYSFEFIPGNIEIFKKNVALNPHLKERIFLQENPVSDSTGTTIYFKDHGPGSKVEFKSFDEQTGIASTLAIDDFVKENAVDKVDFIKMDIEGAEPDALEGAIETIKKFRPTLAIAIYHSMEDFENIPNWIIDLGLDYELFLGHYTIHAEETICFAKPRNRKVN